MCSSRSGKSSALWNVGSGRQGAHCIYGELVKGEPKAEIRLPFDRVVADVSAAIVRPRTDRPFEGIMTIHSEISPMAASVYEPGR